MSHLKNKDALGKQMAQWKAVLIVTVVFVDRSEHLCKGTKHGLVSSQDLFDQPYLIFS